MSRNYFVSATCVIALAASMLACNFSTSSVTESPAAPIPTTAITPPLQATGTLPPTQGTAPSATPAGNERPFPVTDPPGAAFEYTTRSGDTLEALAVRFGVEPSQILTSAPRPASGYLPIGLELQVPNVLETMSPGGDLLPDGELVYSPTARDFDAQSFIASAGGYLSRHTETLEDGSVLSGAAIVDKVADENSVNPQLLLALIEFRSGWVFGSQGNADTQLHPIGFRIPGRTGLYPELTVAASQLNKGYYGWRLGTLVETTDADSRTVRWNPTLNAGSVALLHLFALLSGSDRWMGSMAGPEGFPARYQAMFGDAWSRAGTTGPVLPPGLEQPVLELPFAPGERWSLTAGPHNAWTSGTPRGALDLSPITSEDPCAVSARWVTASAPGVVVRAGDNVVALDLDGDGRESTGWVLVYYHLAEDGLIASGTSVATGDPLGHPSCEGGRATGKHVHLARKYNGEWLAADGPIPFVLSGWRAVADKRNYYGSLVRGGEQVTSDSSGMQGSTIWR
jgi:murein DD-endopeptidase MepM/ murein hydrolase activator NlpD